MKLRFLSITALAALLFVAYTSAGNTPSQKEEKKRQRMEEITRNLPDSVFENVKMEDLLDDEVYLKLARDGWSSREITTIMETAVSDKKTARLRGSYGAYAKEWRPAFGRAMSDDPLYQTTSGDLSPQAVARIIEAVGADAYNQSWEIKNYDPTARKKENYIPDNGYFKPVLLNPSSGRSHWIVVNQANENGDELYVVPDGAGIYSTHDCGKSWTCITDNIPDRANRSVAQGYAIPVDPDKWDHLFAFMNNSTVYETDNGGKTWVRVSEGSKYATHKNFKRGYAFKDKEGTLKLIGADMQGNRVNNKLWLSTNKGVDWKEVSLNLTDAQKETVNNTKGFWFQQMAFDPSDRDIVYFPGSYSILYFDDGGRSGNFKQLEFTVYGKDESTVRYAKTTRFPFNGNGPGYLEIDPNNPDRMWYAVGNSNGNRTALYYSKDHGKSWITLHEPAKAEAFRTDWKNFTDSIGGGSLFGNEIANVWLGGFGIEYTGDRDTEPKMFFGCSMSSAYSMATPAMDENGGIINAPAGRYWTEYAWGRRQRSYITEGLVNPAGAANPAGYYEVSASRHNADNHCIASHKNGRVFRGGDGGLFVHDPKISGVEQNIGVPDWVNISSNLGQMLFYNVRVNEFGDQAIIGNTQDIDVQTYRYGRWGHWRGYEGTESSFNPYTSTGYFSGGGGAGPDGMKADSWHTARNYADVVTGDWFMLRTWSGNVSPSTLYRVEDIGRSLTDLYPAINKTVTDVALARDKGRLTVFARSNDNALWMSTDSCQTFEPINAGSTQAKFSYSHIAADPDNSDILYIGQNGGIVLKFDIKTGKYTTVGSNLPNTINCSRLFFHEGSGDLYYVDNNSGVYILKNGEEQWKFWIKGYNGGKFTDSDINYTTQEFVIADYGRGVWVADLENPSDRYFDSYNAPDAIPNRILKVKEISHRDGRRVFGIDTDWTIPMYYNYKWTINGVDVNNPYQYLNIDDKNYAQNFTVQLELSLREAPYVKTLSEPLTVSSNSESKPIARRQGNALYNSGDGRVDIGYMDWFYKEFSVDFWIKPQSDGVILANTAKNVDRGAKGWMLYIEGGVLKFKYYPFNQFNQPTYEVGLAQNDIVNGSAIVMNKWSHVAVTSNESGEIHLYLNGEQVGTKKKIRETEDYTLNNSVIMSLFGDAFESSTLKASVDELKFWRKALTLDEVRREMFSTDIANPGYMVAHYDFNGENLAENTETFTGYKPKSRTRAVTSPERMTVPVNANFVAHNSLNGSTLFTAQDGKTKIMTVDAAGLSGVNTYVYGYTAERWSNPDDNLSEDYFEPTSLGYMIRTFGVVSPDTRANVTFHNGETSFEANKNYRLYMASNAEDRMYWQQYKGSLVRNSDGTITLNDAVLADLTDKKLLIVTMKPAIELTLEGLSSDGRVILYDDGEDLTEFPFTARLIEKMTVKGNSYEIISDSTVVIVPEKPLSFDSNGVAKGVIKIDTDLVGDFNNVISTYIRGKNDNDMIPIPVDILNRISPRTLNNSVQITGGGMKVGTAADFAALTGTQNLTIMGWVRIDSESMMDKGRNGDGVSPLLFFRTSPSNAGTTGIHLRRHTNSSGQFDGAMLGYHWNDVAWNYNATTPFIIPKEDVGKWNHVALVVKPEGAWMYFNGMEYKMTGIPNGGMPACTVQSPLLVGMNIQGGNTYFNGAFDHVAVWDRSLSQEEIQKYMHNRVLLNDPNLLEYLTMDEKDENGRIKESLKGMSSVYYGTVSTGTPTPVPFAPFRQDMSMSNDKCPIKVSGTTGSIATFEGTPFNYIAANDEAQTYLPLNNEFYTLIYDAISSKTGELTLTYDNESLEKDDDVIALGIRELGSTKPFTELIESSSISNKKATFTVPTSRLTKSSEIMFFATPETSARPTIVRMAFAKPTINSGDIYLLGDRENEIPIEVNVVSGTSPVQISAVEDYVSLSKAEINMKEASQEVIITIDKNKLREIDKFGLHDVTVNLSGVNADPLTLKVGLKPIVRLKLKNGDGEDHFTATKAVSTLDIDIEVEEGYLSEDVALEITPKELKSTFNITNGSLLLNEPVEIPELKLGSSGKGEHRQGWNLIGNPYLSEINLTKHQNYDFEDDAMTHFVYHTVEGSDNVFAYDMTDFDDRHHIIPFQSYYVQTMKDDASFTVTDVAKEKTLSRKTFDYYSAEEKRSITLSLQDANGDIVDRTTVEFSNDATGAFKLNEDAPKVRSVSGTKDELYTLTSDRVESSINVHPIESNQWIPLCIDVRNPGDMKLVVSKITGFDGEVNKIYLGDIDNNYLQLPLKEGDEYPLTVSGEGPLERRLLVIPTFNNDVVTGAEDVEKNHPDYRVYTGKRTMTVTGLQGDAEISVFSPSGMLVVHAETSDDSYTAELNTGAYIVTIREGGKDYSTKIVVK